MTEDSRLHAHAAAIADKPMLQQVFEEFHRLFRTLDEAQFGTAAGARYELGAGVFPVRNTYPDVVATDIVAAPGLDRVLDAEAMDLAPTSVRAFYGQNCFHHFPHPEKFFAELIRTTAVHGGAILIEPADSLLARLLYPRLFKTEGYDLAMQGWHAAIEGPMAGANQALSHIVFRRDRDLFEARFPQLEIVTIRPLGNYIRYIISGGLNFPQLLPDFCIPALRLLETILSPLHRIFALHHIIVLRHR